MPRRIVPILLTSARRLRAHAYAAILRSVERRLGDEAAPAFQYSLLPQRYEMPRFDYARCGLRFVAHRVYISMLALI